jgi:hypothetical protein
LKKARNGKRGEENILTVNGANDKNEETNIQNLMKKNMKAFPGIITRRRI